MTLATAERRIAALRAAVAPPPAVLSPLQVAAAAGIVPDPWQRDVLTSTDRQLIILASRQSGKSTTTAILAAHRAAFHPKSLVLVVSPTLRQSGELFRKTRDVLAALGDAAPPAVAESALRVELANGSRVVSLPGVEGTVRGYSAPDLIVFDEASRAEDGLYFALRPMLATNPAARLILLSTPWGRQGFFFDVWTEGGPGWRRVKATAEEVPRISAAWLAAERAALPAIVFQQEYECSFAEPAGAVFAEEHVRRALNPAVLPLWGGPHAA